MADPRGYVVGLTAVGAGLGAETIIAKFPLSILFFKKTLAASTKVLQQLALGVQSAPKLVGKAAGWTEHLHRHRIGGGSGIGGLRSVEIVPVAGVIVV